MGKVTSTLGSDVLYVTFGSVTKRGDQWRDVHGSLSSSRWHSPCRLNFQMVAKHSAPAQGERRPRVTGVCGSNTVAAEPPFERGQSICQIYKHCVGVCKTLQPHVNGSKSNNGLFIFISYFWLECCFKVTLPNNIQNKVIFHQDTVKPLSINVYKAHSHHTYTFLSLGRDTSSIFMTRYLAITASQGPSLMNNATDVICMWKWLPPYSDRSAFLWIW